MLRGARKFYLYSDSDRRTDGHIVGCVNVGMLLLTSEVCHLADALTHAGSRLAYPP